MPEWSDVLTAVTSARPDDREGSLARLRDVWDALGDDDHAQKCVVAHYAADLESVLDDEVRWDEAAFASYAHVGDEDLAPVGIPSARGLAPSLHLNLADGYLRQGRLTESRHHLDAATEALPVLADDGYGQLIRDAVAGVSERWDLADSTVGSPGRD
ncbi:hypothetical protein [Knoellia subterranea]|uniref:Tetratricopeptide repeat protein n=1 Tax=Knoellia subterranea KCTC 19937 TaxID=1385521 RepID=A0A0A0JQB3_9MICO|nr:hypothetical protein [Knoellia subterranea]KGN37786.1 hypothetical protein N803_12060 [Knoellia subterranea KCTC 19937]